MARFIQAEYPRHHAGVERVARGVQALRSLNTTHLVLSGLAALGAPVTRAAARLRGLLQARAAARRQRREDEKLWSVALTDARVMADLSRAMAEQARRYRDLPGYY